MYAVCIHIVYMYTYMAFNSVFLLLQVYVYEDVFYKVSLLISSY